MKRVSQIVKSGSFIAFGFGFVFFFIIIIPVLINDNGIFTVCGDYDSQSIPFTYHIRDAILSGEIAWDHSSGLGAQFLSSYAYYNLFSPFSLFYLIVPRACIIYIMPFVTALKFGTGCMTAYLFASRYIKKQALCRHGGHNLYVLLLRRL